MTSSIFESQDIPLISTAKRLLKGSWVDFMWEPALSINGEVCMSTVLMTFEDGIIDEAACKNELLEGIRLTSIADSLKHYAFIGSPE